MIRVCVRHAAICALVLLGGAAAAEPIEIGSRLELFVDRYLIDTLDGAQLELHSPAPQEVAFHMDAPWEGNYCGYHSLVEDGDRFRYYHRGAQRLPTDTKKRKFAHMVTCCTESGDAIHWKRPMLGLFDFQGSKDNNIVLKSDSADAEFVGYSSCFMVSLNANPAAKPEERYIALAHSQREDKTPDGKPIGRHSIFTSPDGHRFTMKSTPVLDRPQSDAGGDVVFWDTNLGTYVAYLRVYWDAKAGTIGGFKSSGVRSAVRVTSPDLEHWSEPEVVLYGDARPEDLYTMMPQQYFRAPHLYIGLPTRFMPKRKAVKEWYRDGVNDGVFVTSRDGLRWDRTFMEAFVRPGPDPANWTSRAIYLTRGVVQTGPTEMSVYWYEHGDHGPKDMQVRRGSLRLDGFASVSAPFAGGEMVTKPLVFAGGPLVLNYSTSAAGSIRVEIQDADGTPIPGFTLAEFPERYGDEIEGVMEWTGGADVRTLAGKPVRLRFVLKDADVYSLRFGEPTAVTERTAPGADPGVPFDLQGFIDGELAAGKRRIVVPPGRHRVTPIEVDTARLVGKGGAGLRVGAAWAKTARMHLFLAGLDGVEIVADGAEMICTEPTGAIVFVDCRNVTLSGLTIDYDPLPFTQGRITGLSPDTLVHEIELFPDYPAAGSGTAWKYEIFASDTGLLRFGSYYDFTVERLGDRSLRLTKTGPSKAGPGTERVGDIVTLAFVDWTPATLPHAIFLNTCTGMTLADCTLHAANCFGFFETGCDGSTYRRCRVDRRPPETDPRPRAVPRMRSLNADAFHSKHAPRGPRYLGCVARFMGDDCVAINGDYELVTSCTAGTVRVLAKVAMRIREGGTVEVVTPAGRHPTAPRVVKVAPAGPITAAERDYVRGLPLDGRMRGTEFGMLATAYEVTLDEPLDLPRGSVIAAADALGADFVIEGCDFGFNRSRGVIVKAGRGRIVGNRFTENWMEAIKLAPEYYWLEAGCGDDLVIEGNTITRCHDTAIRVSASLASDRPLPAGAHRRITIADNHLADCPSPRIHVTSTDGLVVRGNTVLGGTAAEPAAKTLLLECCSTLDVQDRFGPPSEGGSGTPPPRP